MGAIFKHPSEQKMLSQHSKFNSVCLRMANVWCYIVATAAVYAIKKFWKLLKYDNGIGDCMYRHFVYFDDAKKTCFHNISARKLQKIFQEKYITSCVP